MALSCDSSWLKMSAVFDSDFSFAEIRYTVNIILFFKAQSFVNYFPVLSVRIAHSSEVI